MLYSAAKIVYNMFKSTLIKITWKLNFQWEIIREWSIYAETIKLHNSLYLDLLVVLGNGFGLRYKWNALKNKQEQEELEAWWNLIQTTHIYRLARLLAKVKMRYWTRTAGKFMILDTAGRHQKYVVICVQQKKHGLIGSVPVLDNILPLPDACV